MAGRHRGNDNEEDGLFVHVPAKQKGGISTQSNRSYKSIPSRTQPEFDEAKLNQSVQEHNHISTPRKHTSWNIKPRVTLRTAS
ncbi:hypothetical protein TMatcc_002592 [Talaromyces marneffei ATCC 18224]